MKSKIILMLVISSLIIGCVDVPKSIASNNEISDTITSISDKLLGISCSSPNGLDSPKLTTEQCDYWVENNINNKYVTWQGTISNVKDGIVYVSVNYQMPNGLNKDRSAIVKLYDIRKDEVLKYNIKDNIQFIGKINIERGIYNSYYMSWTTMINHYDGLDIFKGIELHDSKIIKPDNTESSIKSNVQSGISSVTSTVIPIRPPQIGIRYHIDTSPRGNGVVYINNKISPTTGTLPPGSYNIKLVVGSKTYESTMFAAEGGSIELIQPME